MRRSTALFLLLSGVSLVPLVSHAASIGALQPIFSLGSLCGCPPTTGASGNSAVPDWGCVLQTFQTLMNDFVSFATIIITIFIAWAGVGFIANPTNSEARTKARQRLTNAIIGLLIVLAAWLLVDTVMKTLYNPNASDGVAGGNFGPWNSILSDSNPNDKCIQVQVPKALPGLNATTNAQGGPTVVVSSTPGTAGAIQQQICNAANAYKNTPTTACNCGGSACAWSVNQVLQNAGLQPMGGSSVLAMQSAIQGGRGSAISQSSAVCGDLVMVINNGENHVGVCLNAGCTSTISNSSSRQAFNWISPTIPGNPIFGESYSASAPRYFYRVNN